MTPNLDTIPPELLECIAYYAAESTQLGPPTDLASLILVSRRFETTLSLRVAPHLYARIFSLKFDAEAHIRRLGPSRTQLSHLATELKRRFIVLRRVRAREACSFAEDRVPSDDDVKILHEILWTAYVMMLENDGLNEQQLREFAHIREWLSLFWFDLSGASWAMKALQADDWAPSHDLSALAMWTFWLSLRSDDYLDIEQEGLRVMIAILKSFAIGAHHYPIMPPSRTPMPDHLQSLLPSYGAYPPISPSPLAYPAILSFLALAPLLSKRQEPVPAPTSFLIRVEHMSHEWDIEWARSAVFADPTSTTHANYATFLPGSITGIWEGMFTYVDFNVYASLLDGAPPSQLVTNPVARHQQTFRLREYHLLGPEEDELFGNETRPLSSGNPLRAGIPNDAQFFSEGDHLHIIDPGRTDPLLYKIAPAREDGGNYASRIRDILIMGEGHSAWGQFNLLGRVRAHDGFILLSKEYVDGDRGTWLYRGYLIGAKYGSLAGRWRDTLSPHDQLGYEGCFFMSRRR